LRIEGFEMSNLFQFLYENELLDLNNGESAKIAGSVSSKDIVSADVRTYFREQLLWYWKNPQNMSGEIENAISSGSLPEELKTALGEMWSSLFGQSASFLKTASSLEISQRIKTGIEALELLRVMSKTQTDGFYALGGGLLFPGVTESDVQKAKDDEAARVEAEQKENRRIEAESELRQKWNIAMGMAGAEEAFYKGDKDDLNTAINSALVAFSELKR